MEITLNPGTLISGIYEIVRYLGSGSDGDVQLVKDVRDGTLHAMKLVSRDHLNREPVIWEHYHLEVVVAQQVNSRNIIRTEVFSEDASKKIVYLVKEYVDGQSLQDYLRFRGKLPFDEALTIARECAKALAALTAAGIVHRDLKPENIMMGKDNIPRLDDFGIALVPDCKDSGITEDGKNVLIGTPAFSAPEQWTSAHTVDAMADIYSLGVILYLMVTGELPFPEEQDPQETIRHVLNDSPRPASELNEKIPAILDDLISAMIDRRISKRPQGADDLIRWIDTVIWELPKAAVRVKTDRNEDASAELPLPEEQEEISEEELLGTDVREKQKKQKIVITAISVFAALILLLVLDTQFHFTKKIRRNRNKEKTNIVVTEQTPTETKPAVPPPPVGKAETKPAPVILPVKQTAKELPPESWDNRTAAQMEKRMKEWKLLRFTASKKSTDALADLTRRTGLKFQIDSISLDGPCRIDMKNVTLYDAVKAVLKGQSDAGFRTGKGVVSVYSISGEKKKAEKAALEKQIQMAAQRCSKELPVSAQQISKQQKTAKSLNNGLKAKRSGPDALRKAENLKKRAASLSASVEKTRISVKKLDDLLFPLPVTPVLENHRKNLNQQKELLSVLIAESDRLKTAAEDAVNKEKELLKFTKEEAARKAAIRADQAKKEQKYQAELARKKKQAEDARKAELAELEKRQKEAERKAAELTTEQKNKLIEENYAKAKAAVTAAEQEAEELNRAAAEARKVHRKLTIDNRRYPYAQTSRNLEKAKKDLAAAEQKRKTAEAQYEAAVKKAANLQQTVGVGSQEIRNVQKAKNQAHHARVRAAGMEKACRLRLEEANRLFKLSQTVEDAGKKATELEKQAELKRQAKIRADENLLKAEDAWFEMRYHVKERNFALMNSAVPVWKGKNAEQVNVLLKELFVTRIRFCDADVEKAFKILEKATRLTITLSDDLIKTVPRKKNEISVRRTITCDAENTNLMDFLMKICNDPKLSPSPRKPKIACAISADGKIALSLRSEE